MFGSGRRLRRNLIMPSLFSQWCHVISACVKARPTVYTLYTVSGKKEATSILGITLTNLNTVLQFLARIILILQCIKTLKNLPNTPTALRGDDVISIAKRIRERKLESSLIKSFLEKLINSVLNGSGCRQALSRHCSVQWRREVAVSQHALRRRYTL